MALIRGVHLGNKHSEVETTVAIIHQRTWIPGLKGLAVKLNRSCLNRQRHDSRSQITPEPPLPVDRVVLTAPFSTVGVNSAGPLYTRDAGKTKFYILFVHSDLCRALELVGSLSTQDTILAFRHFVARRGHPNIVYSDNSKTFIALSRHLSEKMFFCRPTGKFITPRAHWVGGWWERLLQSSGGSRMCKRRGRKPHFS